MKYRKLIITAAAAAMFFGGAALTNPALAQGGGETPPMQIHLGADLIGACSATNAADVAAKALNMTAAELRVALASGKTLNQIATEKGVTVDTVQKALDESFVAEVDQALKDGLITEEQATLLKQMRSGTPAASAEPVDPAATPAAPDSTGANPVAPGAPGIVRERVRMVRGMFIPDRNVVKPVQVAASAMGISCPELAKALQGGKSIAQVAQERSVNLQTIVDALVKAYSDALDQDFSEGLISKVELDSAKSNQINHVLALVSRIGAGEGGRMGGRVEIREGRIEIGVPGQGNPGGIGRGGNNPGNKNP